MQIRKSAEDYLEAILVLSKQGACNEYFWKKLWN